MNSLRNMWLIQGPFTTLYSKGVDIGVNTSFLEDWFDKTFAEGAFSIFLCSMEAISLMGGMYKIFAKVMANRLHKSLPSIIHNSQYGFFAKRDILHNILNVQMAFDYAKESKQELVFATIGYRESLW